jgi:hypothetical protein
VPVKIELRYAAACAVLSVLSFNPALAADGGARLASRDSKAACAHEANGLKGEDHDKFVSLCLKSHEAQARPVNEARHDGPGHDQQNRMKSCNEQAGKKELKGDERRSFMSACLKG